MFSMNVGGFLMFAPVASASNARNRDGGSFITVYDAFGELSDCPFAFTHDNIVNFWIFKEAVGHVGCMPSAHHYFAVGL